MILTHFNFLILARNRSTSFSRDAATFDELWWAWISSKRWDREDSTSRRTILISSTSHSLFRLPAASASSNITAEKTPKLACDMWTERGSTIGLFASTGMRDLSRDDSTDEASRADKCVTSIDRTTMVDAADTARLCTRKRHKFQVFKRIILKSFW